MRPVLALLLCLTVACMRSFWFSLTGDASPPPGEAYINGGEFPR